MSERGCEILWADLRNPFNTERLARSDESVMHNLVSWLSNLPLEPYARMLNLQVLP